LLQNLIEMNQKSMEMSLMGTKRTIIEESSKRIAPYLRETPVERSAWLSSCSDGDVFLKLENFQITGSFKARGALNKLTSLTADERKLGVVTASSGNHGAAVAYGSNALGVDAEVYVPKSASPAKIAVIKSYGAQVELFGDDCVETEARARARAEETGRIYISPYNDETVMAGQGTVGVELHRRLETVDAVFVSLGGGGLIGGMGTYLKETLGDVEIVAVSPEQSPAMHECLEAGKIIDVPCFDTLSDGTAGGVEPGAITYEVCAQVVDRSLLVSEDAIAEAMRTFIEKHRMMIEGAAGVALAGFLQVAKDYKDKRVAIIVCGANISLEKLSGVIK
jgi:threonine dehydratase